MKFLKFKLKKSINEEKFLKLYKKVQNTTDFSYLTKDLLLLKTAV